MTVIKSLLRVVALSSTAILLMGLFFSLAGKTHTEVIPASEAQSYQGKAFVVQMLKGYVPLGSSRPDTNHDPQASNLVFLVDGEPLVPHQLHADLISGKPGFSHWGDSVIFSTGNPDLKETAKELHIVAPLQLPLYALWLAFALFIVSLWSLYRENCLAALRSVNSVSTQIGWIVVGGFSLLIVWSVWTGYPEIPIVPLDGLGYITWSPKVPIGYPAFISLFAKLFSSLNAVIFAQVILYCIAVLFFYWQASKFFISPFVAALMALLLLGAGRVMNYNLLISTDGLFATLIIFHMAAAFSVIRSSSTASLIATGITIGLAIFVRPAAYFLLGGLFVLFAVVSGHRLRILKIAGTSVAMIMLFIFIVTSVTQGTKNRSILGLALFPHVMHLYKPLESSINPKDISAIDNVTRDYRLAMNEAIARSWRTAYDLETNSFNPISGKIYAALYAETGPTETRRLEILSIFEKLAHETVLNDPIGYFKIVAINFYAAYTRNTFLASPPGYANHEGAPLSWWLEQTRENALSGIKQLGLPVPNANSAYGNSSLLVDNPPKHLDLLHYFSPLQRFVALAAAPLLILGLFFSRSKKDVSLVGVYALTLHIGGTLLVCLTTVAIPRYSVPLDVLMIIAIGCAVDVCGFHIKSFAAKFLRLNHA